MTPPLLEGKTAVITGAGRGIGAAAAALFAEAGAQLVLSDLDAEPLADVAKRLQEAGTDVATMAGDVTEPDFPAALLKLTRDAFGTPDVLVNNAGYTWDSIFHKMDERQWKAILDVHLTAPYRMMQTVGGSMREAAKVEQQSGRQPPARKIVNLSSTSGTSGNVGQANYSAAKAGVVGLTKAVAKEWGRFNVYVNAVAFGWIETRLTQDLSSGETISREGQEITLGVPRDKFEMGRVLIALRRPGTAEEAAGVILFLSSPLSNYMTAQVLVVDGGR